MHSYFTDNRLTKKEGRNWPTNARFSATTRLLMAQQQMIRGCNTQYGAKRKSELIRNRSGRLRIGQAVHHFRLLESSNSTTHLQQKTRVCLPTYKCPLHPTQEPSFAGASAASHVGLCLLASRVEMRDLGANGAAAADMPGCGRGTTVTQPRVGGSCPHDQQGSK
jgi:hypothetical protein